MCTAVTERVQPDPRQVEVTRDCGLPVGDMANLLLVLGAGTVVRVSVCFRSSCPPDGVITSCGR